MSLNPSEDVLFCGIGKSAVAWYRAFMPAMFMGADWVGLHGDPPDLHFATGLVKGSTAPPDFYEYKVVVLQQPAGAKWLGLIRKMQQRGIKVLFEVDDYLHGIRKKDDHDFREGFGRDRLKKLEMCMRACDGLIVSTPWLGGRYRSFNRNVFVCRNGIDPGRYNLTRPERPTVNIGWAGATGHARSIEPWLHTTAQVMRSFDETCFVSIGQPYAEAFKAMFGEERAVTIPFTLIEQYPSAMTMFDIGLAPAGKGSWYRGKSDLRWLEAAALAVPVIADPTVYPDIEVGVTGFHAETAGEMKDVLVHLIEEPDLRRRVGEQAKAHVLEHRSMRVMVNGWLEVFEEVLA